MKAFLQKAMFQIGLKNFFVIKKVFISDLKVEEIFGTFYEKELEKTYQKDFRAEK